MEIVTGIVWLLRSTVDEKIVKVIVLNKSSGQNECKLGFAVIDYTTQLHTFET